jgi:hypothetical protein
MTPHNRRILWSAAAGGAALAVVAGGVVWRGAGDDDAAPARRPNATATTPDQAVTWPLLGTPGDDIGRPALAVKIDDTDHGRPQTGLAQADVVVEEVVEGGLTRLVAIFHSQDPDTVGPVRSARSTDIPLLAELGRPLFAWSGANPTFAAAVRAADLVDVGAAAAPGAYERSDDRRAPYNLYASPDALRAAGDDADPAPGPPPALFAYRPPGTSAGGIGDPATGYTTAGTGGLATTIRWDWDADAETWRRTQNGTAHVDDEGTQVTAANVVVRSTPYRYSGVRDSAGGAVPEAAAVGDGDAWLLTGGRAIAARWHKPSVDAATTYTTTDGAALLLTPGRTWIEILPPGAGQVLRPDGPT